MASSMSARPNTVYASQQGPQRPQPDKVQRRHADPSPQIFVHLMGDDATQRGTAHPCTLKRRALWQELQIVVESTFSRLS